MAEGLSREKPLSRQGRNLLNSFMTRIKTQKGFTLIELLVVISIIGVLASVVMVSLNSARVKARDAVRKSDLNQIALAMRLYYDEHEYYPRESEGSNGKVGAGSGLDTMLAPYIGDNMPHDPLGPGNSGYYYYYDGRQWCDGKMIAVVFARNMEQTAGNNSDICAAWGGEGGAGRSGAYHIYIGPSDG